MRVCKCIAAQLTLSNMVETVLSRALSFYTTGLSVLLRRHSLPTKWRFATCHIFVKGTMHQHNCSEMLKADLSQSLEWQNSF